MHIKVYGQSSVQDGETLCDTCRLAHVIRGRRANEEMVFCQATPMQSVRITFRVRTCSEYIDDREPSYPELVEKAWILRPASHQRAAGFVRASDLKADELGRYLAEPSHRD